MAGPLAAGSIGSLDGGMSMSSPNPENKLFVGGAPPGTDEATLQQVRTPERTLRGHAKLWAGRVTRRARWRLASAT